MCVCTVYLTQNIWSILLFNVSFPPYISNRVRHLEVPPFGATLHQIQPFYNPKGLIPPFSHILAGQKGILGLTKTLICDIRGLSLKFSHGAINIVEREHSRRTFRSKQWLQDFLCDIPTPPHTPWKLYEASHGVLPSVVQLGFN